PVAQHVVADVVEQFLLLRDRHHDVLDRDDLVDDVADFLARRIGVEARELREIDRLDQRAEHRALGLVVALRAPGVDRQRLRLGGETGGRGRRRQDRRTEAGGWNRLQAVAALRCHRRRGGLACRGRGGRHRTGLGGTTLTEHGSFPWTLLFSAQQLAEQRREQAALRFLHLGAAGEQLREQAERL